mmetsp:Transcript_48032/g.56114  ORF Transcript_48032/g.56114 Transcript_48032/m.56114 type:complete len:126 (-) Transcript_48032:52-429(-)
MFQRGVAMVFFGRFGEDAALRGAHALPFLPSSIPVTSGNRTGLPTKPSQYCGSTLLPREKFLPISARNTIPTSRDHIWFPPRFRSQHSYGVTCEKKKKNQTVFAFVALFKKPFPLFGPPIVFDTV